MINSSTQVAMLAHAPYELDIRDMSHYRKLVN